MEDLEFIFEMPNEQELVKYISIKGEKGDTGDVSKQQLDDTKKELENTITEVTTIEKTTDIAEALIITDCAGVKGKLDIKSGKSIQEGEPTPDTPIDIRNVGDNINLIDITTLFASYVGSNGNFYDSTSNGEKRSDFIKVEPNTEYTFKIHETSQSNNDWIGIGEYSSNNTSTFIQRDVKSNASFTKGFEYTIKTTTTTEYIVVSARNLVGATKIKLEKGKVATSYSKYGCGSVGVKTQSKNLVNVFETPTTNSGFTLPNLTISEDGFVTYENTGGYRTALFNTFEAEPSTTYYSFLEVVEATKTPMVYLREFNEKMEQLKVSYPKNQTFVTTESTKYIQYGLTTNAYTETGKFKVRPMVVKSNIADNIYKPYEENTVVFPFAEGQLLHEGDCLSEDGIHQVRKTLVLNGTENWIYSPGSNGLNRFEFSVNDIFTNTANILSTHFKYKLANEYNCIFCSNLTQLYIVIDFTSVDEFKAYLAEQYANGTPVTIEYELATETITPYTEEQKEAYYRLQHLQMYEGYTSIKCTEEIKPDIQVTYLYNNEINKTFGSRIDKLEEEVHELKKQVADLTAMVLSV